MTAIIILNWNGWKDTVECLCSLYAMYQSKFFIILIDNGSTDESIKHITTWFNENKQTFYLATSEKDTVFDVKSKDCIICQLKNNYGFAKGNNYGIRIAHFYKPDSYLLLNNDTKVEVNFLEKLKEFSLSHPTYRVLAPLICYFSQKNKVWNCGGRLFAGLRKYYYADAWITDIKEKNYITIQFITGCALFFYPELLDNKGNIFTERFFFGEEDFDFSLRMKKKGVKMACVLDSKIYHKVSSSISSANNLGKIYIYYLNRFIDIRLHLGSLSFLLWKYFYIIYIVFLLRNKGIPFNRIFVFINRLLTESLNKNSVNKDDFEYYTTKGSF